MILQVERTGFGNSAIYDKNHKSRIDSCSRDYCMDIQDFHESMRRKYEERERRAERTRMFLFHYLLVLAVVTAMSSATLTYWIVAR